MLKNWYKVYRNSLYNVAHRPYAYLFAGVYLVICLLVFIILPTAIKQIDYGMIISGSLTTLVPLSCFYSSMMAENNANVDERTYILSRPVSRNAYMLGKLLSSLTITFMLFVLVMILCVLGWIIAGPDGRSMTPLDSNAVTTDTLDAKRLAFLLIGLLLSISAGSVMGTCYKYYLKEKLTSILMLLFTIIIYIVAQTALGSHFSVTGLYDITALYMPLLILLPISVVGTIGGFVLTNKANVRV